MQAVNPPSQVIPVKPLHSGQKVPHISELNLRMTFPCPFKHGDNQVLRRHHGYGLCPVAFSNQSSKLSNG